ncbi:DUF4192 domain-containing protein [Streptomyces sp. NPDC014603]|uniref:DUF4192 domain-containing protein n=1 Tax=Streptomyces sp. NPDC014603 TaxID=3364873 RepID=UPI0036F680AB
MTNHSEATGSPENGDRADRGLEEALECSGVAGPTESAAPTSAHPDRDGDRPPPRPAPDISCTTSYRSHGDTQQVTLRSPAELADALPYLLGYRPEDSIVLVALHDKDGQGRFGGRARLGIPASRDDWPAAARQLAQGLIAGSARRGARPEQMILFLCREPDRGGSGRQVKEHLAPLAHALRLECGALDVPVVEALCVSDGRYWSYCCDNQECCPAGGTPMGLAGTSVLAAAATYAGLQVRGTLRELRARLLPRDGFATAGQEAALDAAGLKLVPRILDEAGRVAVADETLRLAERLLRRLAAAPPVSGALPSDRRDDDLIRHDEAATLILGLQDRTTRDRAAEWMEGDDAAPALRLWRALARRCSGPYGEHAAAPLTLAGWVAWSTGDELEAREALAMALGADPDYLFARLLHQACNEGLDPESVRRCLRSERSSRSGDGDGDSANSGAGAGAGVGDGDGDGGRGSRGRAASGQPGGGGGPAEEGGGVLGAGGDGSGHDAGGSGAATRAGGAGGAAAPTPAEPAGAEGPAAPGREGLRVREASSRRRSRARVPGPGGTSPRRSRTDGRRPSARIPRQRIPAAAAHLGGGARRASRPGGAADGGTRPAGARPGGPTPGGPRRPAAGACGGGSPSGRPWSDTEGVEGED